jgi:hypothetical protein
MIEAIIQLWNEALSPKMIALKLGIVDDSGEPDVELVKMVIDEPENYQLLQQQTLEGI